jgi:hypothetical protein
MTVISQIHNIYLYIKATCFGYFKVVIIRLYTRIVEILVYSLVM